MVLNNLVLEIDNDWDDFIKTELKGNYAHVLDKFLDKAYASQEVYPLKENIFSAFKITSFTNVKVVILGQDPYHSNEVVEGEITPHAHGLSFSTPKQTKKIPPSLRNIFKELNSDLGISIPSHGNLVSWAEQGVLLLNATLTVESHKAGSHQKQGWENFTDAAIQYISKNKEGVVFLLWGNFAQQKENLIDVSKHVVLKSTHPSPFSAHKGFLGCKHFSKANTVLKEQGKKEIDWQIK